MKGATISTAYNQVTNAIESVEDLLSFLEQCYRELGRDDEECAESPIYCDLYDAHSILLDARDLLYRWK